MKSDPLGIFNGTFVPANLVQRAKLKLTAPQNFIIPMAIEHGGWTLQTETDRIHKRFILAQRCGLRVEVDEETGRATAATWILTTGEEIHGEYPIEQVGLQDVSIQHLSPYRSTDLNISNPKRVGVAAGTAGATWWATAEHLPAVGEVVLVSAVAAAFLAEKRVRFGMKWGENNYAVGSMIAYGMSIVDAIRSDAPIFPPEGD